MMIFEWWGCPMDDSTKWKQSVSGEVFESPGGIRMAASSLPCITGATPPLPGTCESCELYRAGQIEIEPSPSIDGG